MALLKNPRIGLIGCGSVADFGHLPALERLSELDVVALYDPIKGRAEQYARKFDVPFGTTEIDAFYAQGLDAVCISSSLPAHHDNVLRAAKEGVHVLCEKPIAESESDALEMVAAMEASGKGFFIGFVYRFSNVAQTLKTWFKSGYVGDVRSIRMIYDWHLHGQWVQDEAGEWIESPMWRGRMLEGGPMIDCGVHLIDLVRWITGHEIVQFDGHGAWVAEYEAPDHVYGHLDLDSGVHAMVEMSFSYGHTSKEPQPVFLYELIGTGGVARFDRNGYILEARDGAGTKRVPGMSEKNFDGMWWQFTRFLETGEVGDLASPQDALRATQVATAITEQAISRRVKPVSPVGVAVISKKKKSVKSPLAAS